MASRGAGSERRSLVSQAPLFTRGQRASLPSSLAGSVALPHQGASAPIAGSCAPILAGPGHLVTAVGAGPSGTEHHRLDKGAGSSGLWQGLGSTPPSCGGGCWKGHPDQGTLTSGVLLVTGEACPHPRPFTPGGDHPLSPWVASLLGPAGLPLRWVLCSSTGLAPLAPCPGPACPRSSLRAPSLSSLRAEPASKVGEGKQASRVEVELLQKSAPRGRQGGDGDIATCCCRDTA